MKCILLIALLFFDCRYTIELRGEQVGTIKASNDCLGTIECEDPVGLRAGLLCQAYLIWYQKIIVPMQGN